MMIPLIVGLGIIASLLFYTSFKFEKKHFVLQLLFLVVGMLMLNIIATSVIESKTSCELVLSNTTTLNNFTNYEYAQVCQEIEFQAPTSSFKLITWLLRLFFMYLFVYFFIEVINFFVKSAEQK